MSPPRWFAAVVAAVALLGAAVLPQPVVVVYPMTGTGSIPAGTGGEVSLLIATKLTTLGGIDVKPATPGTDRPKFLDAALAQNADYYITGFLTPLGSDTSLVTQVVSTHSGSVVYSTTAVVRTFADAVAQSDALREAILRHAGRGLAALDAPAPAPSASAAPVANDGNVNLTKALRKRKKAGGVTTVAAAPAASPAGYTTLLFAVGGTGDGEQRSVATSSLVDAFRRAGVAVGVLAVGAEGNLAGAREICKATPSAKTLYGATLSVGRAAGGPSAQVDLNAYDCAGTLLGTQHGTAVDRRDPKAAIDRAARQAALASLGPRTKP